MKPIPRNFYLKDDVVGISRELLGKILCSRKDGILTSGIITETEAYAGVTDKASHAYGNRRTRRTEIMYAAGGTAYVYFCYGMHHLFNIVTNTANIPHAVLIRSIIPLDGIDEILKRRKASELSQELCNGPGKVSAALAITTSDSGTDLLGNTIWLEDRGLVIRDESITTGPRIGINYAGDDALLPYRFKIKSLSFIQGI